MMSKHTVIHPSPPYVIPPLVQQIVSASAGAMIVSMSLTPVDVVRTRLQLQNSSTSYFYTGTFDALAKIAKNEGIRSLWRGLAPSLVMQIPQAGIYYSMYESCKSYYSNNTSIGAVYIPFYAGLSARIFAAAISTPFEYIRTLIQSQTGSASIWSLISLEQLKKRLFTGLGATVLRDAPFSAIYWAGYEYLKAKYAQDRPSDFFVHFASGAISGTIAATVTTPIDVVKTRIQASTTEKKHILGTMHEIFQENGARGFLRGIVPRVSKVAPSCAIMISTYEAFKQIFEKLQARDIHHSPSAVVKAQALDEIKQ